LERFLDHEEKLGRKDLGEIVVQARGAHVILLKANMARVANLKLEQLGGGDFYGVNIAHGRLEIERCDIRSESLACIGVHGGADPRIRSNRIHDGKSEGILGDGQGRGTYEDNDVNIHDNVAGICISDGDGLWALRREYNKRS
jgi:Right handed beta helix region